MQSKPDLEIDPLGLGLTRETRIQLSHEQLERLRLLQNPYVRFDNEGNCV